LNKMSKQNENSEIYLKELDNDLEKLESKEKLGLMRKKIEPQKLMLQQNTLLMANFKQSLKIRELLEQINTKLDTINKKRGTKNDMAKSTKR